jgi:hypothetical protein
LADDKATKRIGFANLGSDGFGRSAAAFVGKRFMQKRLIPIPRLKLSPWYRWENRSHFPMKQQPGVYCLAITARNLEGQVPQWKDVVYIGMTNSKGGLVARWQQFANTINGKEGHSGGKKVVDDLGQYRMWKKKLFVCAMAVECDVTSRTPDDLTKMGWVAFLEFEALAKFARAVLGKYPKYNTK